MLIYASPSSNHLSGLGQFVDLPKVDYTPVINYVEPSAAPAAVGPSIWGQIGSFFTGLTEVVGKYGLPAFQTYKAAETSIQNLKSQREALKIQASAEKSAAIQQQKMLDIQRQAQTENLNFQLQMARLQQEADLQKAKTSMVPNTYMVGTGAGAGGGAVDRAGGIDTTTIVVIGVVAVGAVVLMTMMKK